MKNTYGIITIEKLFLKLGKEKGHLKLEKEKRGRPFPFFTPLFQIFIRNNRYFINQLCILIIRHRNSKFFILIFF